MRNREAERLLWIVLVIVAASSYGLLSALIKLAYDSGLNELQISTGQLAFGAIVLWVIVLFRPKSWKNPLKEPWFRLTLVGFFGLSLTTVFLNSSLLTLNASLSIILLFQFIWISILMESVLNKSWPSRYQWIAVAVVMIGTFMAVGLSAQDFQQLSTRGIIFGFLSAITYSTFLVFTGRVKTSMGPVMKSAVMLTLSLPASVLLMLVLFREQSYLQGNGSDFLFWGLIAGVLGMVIPTVFFNIGIPKIGASLAAMLGSVELPAAIVAALFILGEQVRGLQWMGVGLILLGIIVAEKRAGR